MVCPKCGASNPNTERYCEQCGNPLIEAMARASRRRPLVILAVLGLLTAGGVYADERVNLQPSDRELERVESCSDGGTLRIAGDPAYSGHPWHLVATVPEIRERHFAVTRAEEKWVQDMSGPAYYVRRYERNGQRVLVWDLCKSHECNEYALYAAFDLGSKTYVIELNEKGRGRRLGTSISVAEAAITCAKAEDAKRKSQ
ncbi:zinc-ribbon domain-containing protein [Methylocaldum sp. BRCS4]|nr:zinc-ribbon domain-containing protein [Methylocaldum sp. BRCS4]